MIYTHRREDSADLLHLGGLVDVVIKPTGLPRLVSGVLVRWLLACWSLALSFGGWLFGLWRSRSLVGFLVSCALVRWLVGALVRWLAFWSHALSCGGVVVSPCFPLGVSLGESW